MYNYINIYLSFISTGTKSNKWTLSNKIAVLDFNPLFKLRISLDLITLAIQFALLHFLLISTQNVIRQNVIL